MTAERLYLKDGSPTKAWFCTICAFVARSEKDATRCCHCEDCGALSDKPGQWSRCAACEDAGRVKSATKWKMGDRCWVANGGTLHHGEFVSVMDGFLRVDFGKRTVALDPRSVHRTRRSARIASALDALARATFDARMQRFAAARALAASKLADRALAKAKSRLAELRGGK